MPIIFYKSAALALAAAVIQFSAHAAPVTYEIDSSHTYPSFEADHMGMSVWRGKFTKTTGTVVLDKRAGQGSVDLAIDMNSVDFGYDKMNEVAKEAEMFDTAKYPSAQYKGRLAGFVNGKPTRVVGSLTMRGVTKPVNLKINSFKCMPHPLNKRDFCGADAFASFKRDAFGIDAGKAYGFKMDVVLRIQVEAVAQE